MTPSISDRIDSLIHTLTDVVLPAIDAEKSLERDQAQLVIAHLKLIRTQLPQAAIFDELELAAAIALGRKLLTLCEGGPKLTQAAKALQDVLASPDPADRQDAIRRVNAANEYLVRASRIDGKPASVQAIRTAALANGKAQTLRDRIFFADSGFDADRGDLPDMATYFMEQARNGQR